MSRDLTVLTRGELLLAGPPPIFLKLTGPKNRCMKRYPSQKLVIGMDFFYLKNIVKTKRKMQEHKTIASF